MASILNADNGVVSGSAGLKSNADSSGVLALQSNGATALSVGTDLNLTMTNATVNGVLYANGSKVLSSGSALNFDGTNLQIGTTTNTNSSKLVVNGTISQTVSGTQYQLVDQSDIGTAPNEIPLNQYLGSMAYQDSSAYYNTGITTGFRNRIINGDMRIDQRNAGASVTQSTSLTYITDRFAIVGSVASKFTAQQSSNAAIGFTNSLLCTSSSAYTVGAGEDFSIRQYIEGLNIADLAWGTASASTVTLSFWVRSSLTGTFGGTLANSAQDRFYVFSYTINSANTWEQKTVTIAGDTTGTWLTTNGIGIRLFWSLGAGATVSGTAGSWGSTFYRSVTGANSLVGTNGATFYITGVQLEKGSTATSFDVRSYGTEFMLCQRYYERTNGQPVYLTYYSATLAASNVPFKVIKRATPTLTLVSPSSGSIAAGTGDISSNYVYITSTPTGFSTEYNVSAEL